MATAADEDAAHRRLKEHRYGDVWKREPAAWKQTLSADAKAVQRVIISARNNLGLRRVAVIFREVQKQNPEWTAERWGDALAELESANALEPANEDGYALTASWCVG